jgi:hypothetical protein
MCIERPRGRITDSLIRRYYSRFEVTLAPYLIGSGNLGAYITP